MTHIITTTFAFFFPSLHWAYHISFSQRCAMCSSAPSLSLLATVATATTQPTSAFLLFPSLSLSLSLVLVLCGQQKHTHTPPDHRSTQACRPPVALIRILWLPTANNLKATPPKHSSNLRQSRACKKKEHKRTPFCCCCCCCCCCYRCPLFPSFPPPLASRLLNIIMHCYSFQTGDWLIELRPTVSSGRSVLLCSVPFRFVSFHFIPFHSISFQTRLLLLCGDGRSGWLGQSKQTQSSLTHSLTHSLILSVCMLSPCLPAKLSTTLLHPSIYSTLLLR